jgi:hypothetical protein
VAHDVVVLAEDHVRPVLLDPAARHDGGAAARGDGVAQLDPGHVGDVEAVGQRHRRPLRQGEQGHGGQPREPSPARSSRRLMPA